jgi:hypothetical protein
MSRMEGSLSVPRDAHRYPADMLRRLTHGCLTIVAGMTLLVVSCTLVRGKITLWAIPTVHGVVTDASTGVPIVNASISVTNNSEPSIVSTATSDSNGHYKTAPRMTYEWFILLGDRMEHCTVTVAANGYVTTSTHTAHGTGELWAGQPAADRYIDFALRTDAEGDTNHRNEWDTKRGQDG